MEIYFFQKQKNSGIIDIQKIIYETNNMKFDFLSESDQAYFIHKASTLVEALPYIREHRDI